MRRRQGALLIAFGGIIWGSNGVIANLVSIHPLVIVFFRVFLAVIALGFFLLIRQRTDLLKLNQKGRSLIGLGLLLALTWSMLFAALQALPIGIAVLLNYLAPVLVAILAPIILKEQVTKQSVLGLSISLFGIILVSGITEGFLIFNISGIGFGLIAAITYAMFIVLSKQVLKKVSCEALAFYTYLVAAIVLSPVPLYFGFTLEVSDLIFLLILGVVNTAFAVTLYFYGLNLVRAQDAAVLAYIEPVSAMMFGFIFLFQVFTPIAIIGGVMIISAGIIVSAERIS